MSKEYKHEWYLKNKERILNNAKQYRLDNLDEILKKDRIRGILERKKNTSSNHKSMLRKRKWRLNPENRKKSCEYQKAKLEEYRKENPVKVRTIIPREKWLVTRKKTIKKYYQKCRKDPAKHLGGNMSSYIRTVLKGKKNNQRWVDLVGYTALELIKHLEKQFDDKMTWDNYGPYWHVDHIKPVSLFNYTSVEDVEFVECWSLNNLQPLEASENLRKSNKYPYNG